MISKNTLIVLIIAFIILIIQASWIFHDARKRGEKKYLMWALLGLIHCPTSLIVYLIVTRAIYNKVKCKKCGKGVSAESSICPYCGNDMKKRCKKCDAIVEDDWEFCPECKNKLKELE